MQDIRTGGEPPVNSGERFCSEFGKLVVACKTRINELTSANVEKTSCPPNMQLSFSSNSEKSRRSSWTMALAEESIDEELDMLHAAAEAAEAKAEADKTGCNSKIWCENLKKK